MKKIILLLAMTIANFVVEAQVKAPQASPKSTISQVVGLTDVSVEFSRPSTKGRTIFGDLVPFGKLWRTGANANTIVTFSDDVTIDGKTLAKGKYALYTTPKADNWEVIFYSTTDNWGNPEVFEETKVVLRTNVKPQFLDKKVETFTIGLSSVDFEGANLDIVWEKTAASVRFSVPTQKTTLESMEKAMAGPSAGDYGNVAQYLLNSNGDLNKGLEYINKAISLTKSGKDIPFWYQRYKSLLQSKLGDKVGAIETAKLSLAGSEKAKNDDYVKMNRDSIAEWSKK